MKWKQRAATYLVTIGGSSSSCFSSSSSIFLAAAICTKSTESKVTKYNKERYNNANNKPKKPSIFKLQSRIRAKERQRKKQKITQEAPFVVKEPGSFLVWRDLLVYRRLHQGDFQSQECYYMGSSWPGSAQSCVSEAQDGGERLRRDWK